MPANRKIVLCVGHAFARNYGDRAIYEVIKEVLASHAGLHTRAFPIKPVYLNRAGHTFGPLRKLLTGLVLLPPHYWRLFRRARRSHAVLIGTGNPLMDIHPLHTVQLLLTCLVIRAAGRRIWVFGGGAGPIDTRLGRFCIGAACRLAESVTVRDTRSVEILRQCKGVGPLLRHPAPDVVLSLAPPRPPREPGARLRVGIGAIHYMRPGRSAGAIRAGAYEEYLDRLERLARLVVSRLDADVLVFTNEPTEDQTTVDDVVHRLRDLDRVKSAPVHTVAEAMRVAGSCDLHVGGRLHSVIFSLIQGVPAVALSSHGKIIGLYTDLDATDLLFDIATFEPERVVQCLDALRGPRGARLLANVERLRRQAAAGLHRLAADVGYFVARGTHLPAVSWRAGA
ncbi:MAG TPA: polysaccharide pyruvyl transferase family protein [Gemmatimonadales bacterium]|nr:polysaccharide pyruvyl transferase family protein [Gemmatimonadales bacterium]